MKRVTYFILGLFALLLVILISVYFYIGKTATNYNFTLNTDDVTSEVKIVFDDNAVPHIYANNEVDAMYALGYVQASERLWQMDLIRHVGAGKLSELFGEKMVDNDKFLRSLGIDKTSLRSAEEFAKNAPENIQLSVKAYLNGINKFVKEDNLPLEYKILQVKPEEFEVSDIYRTTGYMAYSFALGLKTDPLVTWLKQNLSKSYLDDLDIYLIKNHTTIPVTNSDFTSIATDVASLDNNLPVPQFIGSNAWVISGEKTKSGKVVFANDAHIAFASPSTWYEAHIVTPNLEYYGNHLPIFPFPLIGHTKKQSWGITMFENDDIDLYQERIKEGEYFYDSTWHKLETRTEKINIKGAESIEFTISETNHGPIINSILKSVKDSEPISMWWTYNQYKDNKLIEGAFLFSRGESIEDVQSGASMIHAPGLNMMYGDIDGNIAWWASAKIPIRPEHIDSKEIIDGTSSKNDIIGWYDFSKNPKAINPQSGYVYSANNAPEKVDDINYPGYYYSGNTRAKLIIEALEKPNKEWTVNDVKRLQMNDSSCVYSSNTKKMLSYLDVDSLNNEQTEMLKHIENWDGTQSTDNIAPTIYYKWMYNTLSMIYLDELGRDRFETFLKTMIYERSLSLVLNSESSPWWDNSKTDKKESAREIVTKSFIKSYNDLEKQLGNTISEWRWGNVHTVTFNHAMGKVSPLDKIFNIGPFKVPSGKDALNKLSFSLDSTGIYNVKSGPSMRIAIDFADIDNSESIIPTGQSGNVMSPFYENQTNKYVIGEYRKQRMDKRDIEANKTGEAFINPIE